MRIEIDGRSPTVEQLWQTATGYGHFTAMQVRGRRTRGFELHVRRLDSATRELFGGGIDGDRVRELIGSALGTGIADASVRVHVFQPEAQPCMLVTVKPPAEAPAAPQRLQSIPYQRPTAHLKHLGGFEKEHRRRLAQRSGFDEVLLTGPDGQLSEGGITNIGFFKGDDVIWPDAPALHGITMQLLELALAHRGAPTSRATVRLADVGRFDGAFVCNSHGIAPVSQIDDVILPVDSERMRTLRAAYDSTPWDEI